MDRIYTKLILSLVCLFCSIPLFGQNADIQLLKNINVDRNTQLDPLMKGFSASVAPISFAFPIGLGTAYLITKNKELAWKAAESQTALCLALGTAFALKYTLQRDRPYVRYPELQNADTQEDPSFPSGHTTSAFCTATSLSLAFPKWYVIAPAFAWASCAAYSRMHLGVHYPTDVLAGALLGSGSALLSHWILKKIRKKYSLLKAG